MTVLQLHPGRKIGRKQLRGIEFAARAVDLEFGHGLFADGAPTENVVAVALQMPEDFLNL